MAGESITVQAVIDSAPAVAGAQQYNRAVTSMRDATASTATQLDKMTGATALLRSSLGALSAAFAIKAIVDAADAYTTLKTKLETMTGSAESGAAALTKIKEVAKASRTSASDMADAFAKMAVGLKENNISQDTAIESLGALSKAMKLSGASAEQTKDVMNAYAEAMIRGRFEGRQFMGLVESFPLLMQKLQAATGGSSEQIRRWALDGKFSAETVRTLLASMADEIETKFATMPRTVGGSFALLGEQITKTLGQAFSDSSTATSRFVTAIDSLRDALGSPAMKTAVRVFADHMGMFVDTTINAVKYIGELWDGLRKMEFTVANTADNWDRAKTGVLAYAAAMSGLGKTNAAAIRPFATETTAVPSVGAPAIKFRETDAELNLKRTIDLERQQVALARARAMDDKAAVAAIEEELAVRSKVTDEIRKYYPQLAANYEAQIRITEQAKREAQILQENRNLAKEFGTTLSDSIITAAKSTDTLAQSFRNVLAQMVEMIAKAIILKPLIDSMGRAGGSALSSAGFNAEQGIFGGGLKSLFGFADGGSFQVGGAGGTDSQLVAFRASPNETVSVTKPGQSGGDSNPVSVVFNVAGDATQETIAKMRQMAEQVFAQRSPALVNASVSAVQDRNVRDRNYLRR